MSQIELGNELRNITASSRQRELSKAIAFVKDNDITSKVEVILRGRAELGDDKCCIPITDLVPNTYECDSTDASWLVKAITHIFQQKNIKASYSTHQLYVSCLFEW